MSSLGMTYLSSPLSGQTLFNFKANLVMAEWTAEGCKANADPEKITTRISALIDAIHVASERTPEAMKNLFAQYESELLE